MIQRNSWILYNHTLHIDSLITLYCCIHWNHVFPLILCFISDRMIFWDHQHSTCTWLLIPNMTFKCLLFVSLKQWKKRMERSKERRENDVTNDAIWSIFIYFTWSRIKICYLLVISRRKIKAHFGRLFIYLEQITMKP